MGKQLVLKMKPKPTGAPAPTEKTTTTNDRRSFAARLVHQGKTRFYTLSMPSDVLAATCVVETRATDPQDGFQRTLDKKRAQDIAAYVDNGGSIPTSVILSAQKAANFEYKHDKQTLSFNAVRGAFLILDGQHRVYGFQLAQEVIRVPVVIYNGLTRSEEATLFIDINTKQKPVPNALLLDIKRMAQNETDEERKVRELFDLFHSTKDSVLLGRTSPSSTAQGKISRVTFKAAIGSIRKNIADTEPDTLYQALNAYLLSWIPVLRNHNAESNITNAVLFRALVLLFPVVAEKVVDRYDQNFSVDNFTNAMSTLFTRVRTGMLQKPGAVPYAVFEELHKQFRGGFTIGNRGS